MPAPQQATKSGALIFRIMKDYCGQCIHLKYEDQNGDGWCDLWQESDVNCKDEACVEFEGKEEETKNN